MSYDYTNFEIKKLDNLIIPIECFFKEEGWYPEEIRHDDGTTEFLFVDSTWIIGKKINDKNLFVNAFSCVGENSGYVMNNILEPALKKSTGKMTAICIWESGDSITQLTVDNGNIKWKNFRLTDIGPSDSLSASEAVYGILAWLTTRKQPVTFSANHDSGIAAELACEFCKTNNLADPRDDYHLNLIHPTETRNLKSKSIWDLKNNNVIWNKETRTMKFELTITPPVDATEDEITEWVEFNVGYRASISNKNPLSEYDLEANNVMRME